MSTNLSTKIYNFLINTEEDYITAGSVIYQAIEDEPWIEKNELKNIIEQAILFANNNITRGSSRYMILLEILPEQFKYPIVRLQEKILDSVRVSSLRAIGAVKTNEEKPLNSNQIADNIRKLKGKLNNKTTPLNQKLFSSLCEAWSKNLQKVKNSELTWKDPLANQIITDDSGLVRQLSPTLRYSFMELARQMTPVSLPSIIQRKCNEFVSTFNENPAVELPRRIMHNGVWKESEHRLAEVTNRILDTLQDAWNNPAFSPEFAGFQSEGTYVNNIVLPTIRATLKDLPLEKSTFVSSSEKQSSASADRRGEGRSGRRPDIMFIMKHGVKKYELLYTECSRLSCTPQKKKDDEVKLWRECNDGLYWVHKSCTPDRDQFGIVGVQIAGSTIRLNVLTRDLADIHRYYHIRDVEIPVQQSNSTIVTKFVETLMIMRNILLVNISLLCNAPLTRSNKVVEKSSTISSPIRENN
ncbi:hypothetical protein Glove_1066g3 [Diversispora epigaea]|uniref:Uncharacterized protein n=1 Tax=Diversispora epigaea TaxID=1348612 RepID=A0A397FXU2_9GLOM|nr:hypothetical protein Glove_1066g3 [Diversispora epigaea]